MLEDGFRSLCILPLYSVDRVLGAMILAETSGLSFFQANLPLLQQIAASITMSLDNAQVYQEISRLKDRLASENCLLVEEISHPFPSRSETSPFLRANF